MRLSSLFTSPSALTCTLLAPSLFVSTVAAQDRTTEQGEAQITDPTEECTPYYYAPVGQAVNQFPPLWTPATILSDDTNAQAKYQSIQSQIPNIAPKGTQPASLEGNWSGESYPSSDPDCWWTFDQCTTPKLAGLPPDLTSVPEPDTLGYGFDDGPNCSHNAFYDYLQQNNQKASMFYIGSNVMDWPLEAQRGLADGHEICMQIIKLVVGVTPTCWRPPFGDVDDRVRAIAHALGLRTILWQYDSNDWRAGTGNITDADVDANYQALITRAQSGSYSTGGTIMLTHELNNFTMAEAVKFYDQLKAAFKYLVPMGVATNQTQPYVETGYGLPNFEQCNGTTTISGGAPLPTGSGQTSSTGGTSGGGTSSSSSSPTAGGSNGAQRIAFDGLGGLAISAAFIGGMLRLLM
ncbi:carbohydrate esterase family 4 protein [Gyrodon lividus]|nr:carbohydrate esterase family 4 protein [Gyrodon lividus]